MNGASFHQGQPDDEQRIDHALIEAATVGLFSERVGLPLLPWQQRFVDHMFIAKETES